MVETKFTADQIKSGNARMRQGGDADNWSTAGTTNYTVDKTDIQIQDGMVQSVDDTISVTFPTPFPDVPQIRPLYWLF